MSYVVTDVDKIKLASALADKAFLSTEKNKEAALKLKVATAFAGELHSIDPVFAKTAGFWRKAGNFLKDNWVDIALTGAMLIPGVNVVAGGARAAYLGARAAKAGYNAYRAINAGRKAVSGAKALRATARGAQAGVRGLKSIRGATANALREGGRTFMRAKVNPLNRPMGLLGSRGTTWSGKVLRPGQMSFGRGVGPRGNTLFNHLRGNAAPKITNWRNASNLRRTGRGLMIGAAGLDAYMGGKGASDLVSRGVAATTPSASANRRLGGTGGSSKMQAVIRS